MQQSLRQWNEFLGPGRSHAAEAESAHRLSLRAAWLGHWRKVPARSKSHHRDHLGRVSKCWPPAEEEGEGQEEEDREGEERQEEGRREEKRENKKKESHRKMGKLAKHAPANGHHAQLWPAVPH